MITDTILYIKTDYHQRPLRFVLEVTAWFMSLVCTVVMGWTLPNPPFLYLYPAFVVQCGIFGWSAWTRGSTGMVANYALIVTIDAIAYIRMIA
jgi:hypothetical protein